MRNTAPYNSTDVVVGLDCRWCTVQKQVGVDAIHSGRRAARNPATFGSEKSTFTHESIYKLSQISLLETFLTSMPAPSWRAMCRSGLLVTKRYVFPQAHSFAMIRKSRTAASDACHACA